MYLCLKVALLVLTGLKTEADEYAEVEEARELVKGWRGSSDEGVRDLTREIVKQMLKKVGDDADCGLGYGRL
jgi:hypothetical protein